MRRDTDFILWFDELGIEDIPLVGGKNASLGEMYRTLTKKGVRIPNGFAVTATAYRFFLEQAGLSTPIHDALRGLDVRNVRQLAERGRKIRDTIMHAEIPAALRAAINDAYHQLSKQYGTANTDVAVRSSATAEDLPDASFAGQQETFLNIRHEDELIEACKKCFASLFTNRAIAYREEKGFDHFKVYLSIGVQKMVRSDLACSGVMFTLDTETGFPDIVFVTGSWGLGENIVQGAVNPDEFFVHKPTLREGYRSIVSKVLGEKSIKMIYTDEGGRTTKNVDVAINDRRRFCLTDDEALELARWGVIIEDHYTKHKGHWSPMDIEWAKDGQRDELFIVQARPETVQSRKNRNIIEEYVLRQKGDVLCKGKSVGNKIGAGKAKVLRDAKDIDLFKPGEVLVTEMTDPDWVPIMRRAKAIVTNRGGRTCFTGDTKILTEQGFMTMEELYNRGDGLKVPSLNRETLKIEWKSVTAVMKKRAPVIEVNTSLTGRQRNTLKLTPDHKMIALENRQLVDVQMQDLLNTQRHVVLAHYIPEITSSTQREQRSAYLLGALSTDGHVRWNTRHGEVTFVQKPTPEKEAFIAQVTRTMQTEFKKDPLIREKPISQGIIRGKPAHGSANSYRWFGKLMAEEVIAQQQQFVTTLLTADQEVALQFLGGVIDGDGTYNAKAHRVSIYCSKEWLLESIIVACLRIGIVPQVSKNRTVANVQLVEKLDLIGHYTHRIHITGKRERIGTRFFAAREVVGDIIDRVNVDGRIKPYVNSNLLISEERLQSLLGKMTKNEQEHVARLLASDIRQQRVTFERELGEQDVYNITVADHHNYIVFTDRYSPILVNNCHAAIVSRELGIPCVVGTNDGTEKIRNGRPITVSCAEGEDGLVYDGILKFERKVVDASRLAKPKTKVMMNVGNPDEAFELSFIPNDGVGLAREEFIITNSIKIHPLALIHFDHITEPKLRAQIEEMTRGYPNKTDFFVEKLAQGVATIAAAFYPKDVIVRMSDFKSNEYAGLIGGLMFEPKEDNPMIGWRGASRYYKPGYEEGFALECKAMKKVRDDMGLTNVKIMIPFCRTVDEGRKVLAVMAKHGLVRHKNGLQVYVMCEIPANVVLAEQFADIFDGFSIGSNDLTQLTLGVDRDSELVADVYDERNAAVKTLIAHVIRVCKKLHRKIGICGQAPSDYPDFAQFLVREGIDSISLNPDSVMRTIPKILAIERKR